MIFIVSFLEIQNEKRAKKALSLGEVVKLYRSRLNQRQEQFEVFQYDIGLLQHRSFLDILNQNIY